MPEDKVPSEAYERLREETHKNRRVEYQSLREEMYRADRTCVVLLTSLATVTAHGNCCCSERRLGVSDCVCSMGSISDLVLGLLLLHGETIRDNQECCLPPEIR